jgi:hypothetical protein
MDALDDSFKGQQRGDAGRRSWPIDLRHHDRQAVTRDDTDSRFPGRLVHILPADAVEKIVHASAPPERSGTKL